MAIPDVLMNEKDKENYGIRSKSTDPIRSLNFVIFSQISQKQIDTIVKFVAESATVSIYSVGPVAQQL